ncbi:unnamed protein product [Trifolium pratense]|uniref:Uncharacterized protein n=1 Tax=Trifolium pratense TaxID=57577 RepID=A0ACB0IGB7_TRIPR|nr:unnamed protein product [Trifolium pratense]
MHSFNLRYCNEPTILEYVKNIAEKDPWDRWEKMHARNNVAFDRIISKLEILLQHYNCSPSSSHGASNSPKYIPTLEPESLNINLLMHDELRSPAKQIEVPSVHEHILLEEEIVAFAKQIEDSSVPAKPISESSEPYFDNLVTDSTKLVDDLGELAFDNVQRIGEFRREDGFEVQCDTNLTVHNSGIIATPELSKAEPITTHSVHNDDTSRLDESQCKVTDNDVAGNRGLSLQSEIPFALYLTSIVNNHASSMEPKFQLHWDDFLTKHKVVLVSIYGNLAVDITGIQYDSRLIPPDAQSSLLNFGHHVFAEMCEQGVLSWTGLILGSVARINGWNGKQVQSDHTSLASFTEWYETPLPKPPVFALLNPLLSLEPPNGVAVENRLMFPSPPKPPGHSFQLTQGELQVTRVTAVLPPPPEPPDVEHIVVVLQGFATLMFPSLTGLRSLYHNGHSVPGSILESLSIVSQFMVPDVFDSNLYTMVSILLSTRQLVNARDMKPLNALLGIDTFYCGRMISTNALHFPSIVFTFWYLDLSATSLSVAKFITSSTTLFGWILTSIPAKYASDHKCLLLLAIIDNGYVVIPTFNIKPVLACTTVRSEQTIKLAQVLIFATWQQISSSDSMSFLYTCASCEIFQDRNGDNKSKNECGNLTVTLIIIAPHVEYFSFIGSDDHGNSWTHHGKLILTGGKQDSLYLWKYVGDDRRVLYIGSDAETLAMMKKSHEFQKKFLWVEVFLVELVFVLIQNSLITFAIFQVFSNQLGTYKKVRKANWDSFHFIAAQDLQSANSGVYYSSHIARSLQCKQWDPGKFVIFSWQCQVDFWSILEDVLDFLKTGRNHNLEDKVGFKGEGIVMNSPYWVGPNRSYSTSAQIMRLCGEMSYY